MIKSDFLKTVVIIVSLSTLSLFFGCRPSEIKRPLGYGNLGSLASYQGQEVVDVSDHALLVRQDEGGLYGMSTLCSRELRRLKARKDPTGPVLFCDVCGSEFAADGTILKGPAVAPLPFFKLIAAEGKPNGPKDTLYARIGEEVDKSWRFPYSSLKPAQ